MNNLYRVGWKKVWPIFSDAKKVLLSVPQQATISKLTQVQACQYCKKYGLYDEEEDAFGEFNSRGAYVDHRSARVGNRNRPSSDDYDEMDHTSDRSFERQHRYEPRNRFQNYRDFPSAGNHSRKSISQDFDDMDDQFDQPQNYRYRSNPPHYRSQQFNFKHRPYERRPSREQFFNDSFNQGEKGIEETETSDAKDSPIQKNFYKEHPEVAARSEEEVNEYRKTHKMSIKGSDIPKPITSFSELSVPEALLLTVKQQNFTCPTPIQAQGWPITLSGRDMIGISQTGSGKTLVFALPAMVHVSNQPRPASTFHEAMPQALILAPTRELAQQIYDVSNKFRHACGIGTACVYGGAAKGPQLMRMRNSQVCVATPGRMNDFLSEGSVTLKHCTYLVLDEADRMLDMGFEPQIRSIIERIRPDRQTLMWSATWPKEVQELAEDFLSDYVQVTIGSEELTANPNIEQIISLIPVGGKNAKLVDLLQSIKRQDNCKTLIFAQTKRTVDFLADVLNRKCGILAMALHGDISQARRDRVLNTFRQQPHSILIATDVAARGLDVNDIQFVINYDMPTNIEDYIHRIGRTARGSKKGVAHSFFTSEDSGVARDLIEVLQKANQQVPNELRNLASSGSSGKRGYDFNRRGYGGRSNYSYGRNRYY